MAKRGRPSKSQLTSNFNSYFSQKPGSYRNLLYGALTVIILFIFAWLGLNLFANRGQISEQAVHTTNEARTYIVREGDTLWKISETVYNDGYQWTKLAEANKITDPNQIEKGMMLTLPEEMAQANITPNEIVIAEVTATQIPTEAPKATLTPMPTSTPKLTPTPKVTLKPTEKAAPTKMVVKPTSKPTVAPTKVVSKPTEKVVPTKVIAKPTAKPTMAPTKMAVKPTVKVAPEPVAQESTEKKITGKTYTIQEGDNLWDISVRAYGDGYRWPELASVNKIPNPDLIYPNDKLVLPR